MHLECVGCNFVSRAVKFLFRLSCYCCCCCCRWNFFLWLSLLSSFVCWHTKQSRTTIVKSDGNSFSSCIMHNYSTVNSNGVKKWKKYIDFLFSSSIMWNITECDARTHTHNRAGFVLFEFHQIDSNQSGRWRTKKIQIKINQFVPGDGGGLLRWWCFSFDVIFHVLLRLFACLFSFVSSKKKKKTYLGVCFRHRWLICSSIAWMD